MNLYDTTTTIIIAITAPRFPARRTLHQSKQLDRHLPAVLHRPELSENANDRSVFPHGGGHVGPERADQTGAAHILVARPGHVGRGQLRQHGVPVGRPGIQPRLVRLRLGYDRRRARCFRAFSAVYTAAYRRNIYSAAAAILVFFGAQTKGTFLNGEKTPGRYRTTMRILKYSNRRECRLY